jgi:hypothetical protein
MAYRLLTNPFGEPLATKDRNTSVPVSSTKNGSMGQRPRGEVRGSIVERVAQYVTCILGLPSTRATDGERWLLRIGRVAARVSRMSPVYRHVISAASCDHSAIDRVSYDSDPLGCPGGGSMRMIVPRLITAVDRRRSARGGTPHAQKIIDQVNTRGLRDLRSDTSSLR